MPILMFYKNKIKTFFAFLNNNHNLEKVFVVNKQLNLHDEYLLNLYELFNFLLNFTSSCLFNFLFLNFFNALLLL